MATRNEVTSAQIGKFAGRLLAADDLFLRVWDKGANGWKLADERLLRALAASGLTQVADKKKPKTKAKRKVVRARVCALPAKRSRK